jgi:peroxiredoxin Q/BCP
MPVTLRERKPPATPAAPPPAAKKSKITKPAATKGKVVKEAKEKAAAVVAKASDEDVAAAAAPAKKGKGSGGSSVGDVIDLEGFGGTIETNDGEETTLKELVEKSGSGVVLFTYPKASTPGCKFYPCPFS